MELGAAVSGSNILRGRLIQVSHGELVADVSIGRHLCRDISRRTTMEPALIMQTATGLLVISAAGGLTMAAIRFAGKPLPPTWLAMLHGFLSAAALTLLIYGLFHSWIAGDGATGSLVVPCRSCRRRFREPQFSLEDVAAAEMARPDSCRHRNQRIRAAGDCHMDGVTRVIR